MHFAIFGLLALASADRLRFFNASDSGARNLSALGNIEYDCWSSKDCGDGFTGNNSIHFWGPTDPKWTSTSNKPPNRPAAAWVHKDPHFSRSEVAIYKGFIQRDTVYYIGYQVQFDNVDDGLFVFQWKEKDGVYTNTNCTINKRNDNVPIRLYFQETVDSNGQPTGQYTTIKLKGQSDPEDCSTDRQLWTKELTMGDTYKFGFIIDTSDSGSLQVYFQGKQITMNVTSSTTSKVFKGNFFPTGPYPKVGAYGRNHPVNSDTYIQLVTLADNQSDVNWAFTP